MSLNGVDISSWQSGLNVGAIPADFVIAKATDGVSYVNPYCDTHIQQAIASGKKWGTYHFAQHSDAVAEAYYYYNNTTGYVGSGIFVLDWEGIFVNDVAWAKLFLDTFYALSGVKPLIYMSESVVKANDWSSVIDGDYGLWVAKYRDYDKDYNYDMSNAGSEPDVNWGSAGYAIWQWTSSGRLNGYGGDLDCDIFYGDATAWDLYANKRADTPTPVDTPAPTPEADQPSEPEQPDPTPVQPPTEEIPETPVEDDPEQLPPIEEPTPVEPSSTGLVRILEKLIKVLQLWVETLKNKKGK